MKRDLNMKYMAVIFGVIALTAGLTDSASANTSVSNLSARSTNRLGVDLGVINEPAPSLLSVNVGYNLTDYMRLSAGVGRLSVSTPSLSFNGTELAQSQEASVTTVGVGAKFMVPGWSLTPTVGVNAASVIYSGTPGMISVGGFERSGSHVYVSGGLDYTSSGGFHLGVGMNHSLKSGVGNSTYVNVGWFFNLLS